MDDNVDLRHQQFYVKNKNVHAGAILILYEWSERQEIIEELQVHECIYWKIRGRTFT